jgi:hypothetical protein
MQKMPKLGKSDLWASNNLIIFRTKPKLVYYLWLQSFFVVVELTPTPEPNAKFQ